jgi:hypothetical protein
VDRDGHRAEGVRQLRRHWALRGNPAQIYTDVSAVKVIVDHLSVVGPTLMTNSDLSNRLF